MFGPLANNFVCLFILKKSSILNFENPLLNKDKTIAAG